MEDNVSTVNNRSPRQALTTTDSVTTTNTANKRRHRGAFSVAAREEAFAGGETNGGGEDQSEDCFEGGDSEVWNAFTSNFQSVQSVLDRNRVLIRQVNSNHQSRVHENLVENVNLIQEINGNISKVVALYSDLSTNFSSAFNQRKATTQDQSNAEKADS
ncbi:PREDICTED: protein EARLY FLOWERING 4-like [Ipomoea nil]|uniref:protein EARLY FLOWERING 4-like n=1 Tax=Ipomoea nil TaxID=35883 RepID=UPI0009008E7F|nr:PREDICTED: protein EARLY FLOWERING 4-like [Ipomoea nil]